MVGQAVPGLAEFNETARTDGLLVVLMGVVFLLSWFAQAVTDRVAENDLRMRDRLDPVGLVDRVTGPHFWSRTLQSWQSEMLAIGSMTVFATYLRERGSKESKPVGMPHDVTTSDD